MWVCGLKHFSSSLIGKRSLVTPYVGVWIETCTLPPLQNSLMVTPYVGVWIETRHHPYIEPCFLVTPYVGVWIETW